MEHIGSTAKGIPVEYHPVLITVPTRTTTTPSEAAQPSRAALRWRAEAEGGEQRHEGLASGAGRNGSIASSCS